MTGLDKWKKEQIAKIEKMTIEDVIIEIWNGEEDLCERCEYKIECEGSSEYDTCEKGIKAYLDMEIQDE